MREPNVTREPEASTKAETDIGPHQFTIRSLMIFTAAVAGFFALATQAPLEIAAFYVLGAIGIWLFPKYWRGIFAGVSYIYLFAIVMFVDIPGFRLPVVMPFLCLASSIYAMFSTNRFDTVVGAIFFLLVWLSLFAYFLRML